MNKFLLALTFIIICINCAPTGFDPSDDNCSPDRYSKEYCYSLTPTNTSLECCFLHALDGTLDICFAMINEPDIKDHIENSLEVVDKINKISCLSDKDIPESPNNPEEPEEPEESEEIEKEESNTTIEENTEHNVSISLPLFLFISCISIITIF